MEKLIRECYAIPFFVALFACLLNQHETQETSVQLKRLNPVPSAQVVSFYLLLQVQRKCWFSVLSHFSIRWILFLGVRIYNDRILLILRSRIQCIFYKIHSKCANYYRFHRRRCNWYHRCIPFLFILFFHSCLFISRYFRFFFSPLMLYWLSCTTPFILSLFLSFHYKYCKFFNPIPVS